MGRRIEERFTVRAPLEKVWAFLVDPRRVVTCLPGAALTEVVDERTFRGALRVQVGPVAVSYQGQVVQEEVDVAQRRVRMRGEGRESTGTGSARMAMEYTLSPLPGGEVEVKVSSEVDVAGRLVQMGRGMIELVAHQLFGQFSAGVKAILEAEAAGTGAEAPAALPPASRPLRPVSLALRGLWAALVAFLRRLAGAR